MNMNTTSVGSAEAQESDTILTLPQQTSAYAIAASCREIALSFMQESERWGKAELAMWLMGPYGQLTQYAATDDRARQSGRYPRAQVPTLREIDVRMVERVIRSAREEVASRLAEVAYGDPQTGFAFDMVGLGFVVRCEDAGQASGWVPSAQARRLADRVLSLFAVDYLVRPQDYEETLSVCHACDAVEFDVVAHARGICARHGSGIFMPGSRQVTIFPELPEGA